MFLFPRLPEKRRRILLGKVDNGPFRRYLEIPLPDRRQKIVEAELLALDFETTGLDARKEAILSIGFTLAGKYRIVLRENGHYLVKVNKALPRESVIIHKITDDRARDGMHLHHVLEILLQKMAGRVLLVHYGQIERTFLNAACQQVYGHKPPMLILDTLEIERRKLMRLQREFGPHHLRLFNLREQYRLPRYNAHSALEDAIATAELFMAEISQRGDDINKLRVKDLL